MAIQGADYEREQMAFKGETRSKRGTEHKPWHTAFWFGIAYDAFSDFGRSIARPLAIWLASGLAFAAIYLWNAGVAVSGWGSACAGDGASKALKAITLSAANALPLIGSSRSEVAAEFYTMPCAAARAGVEPPPPDLADAVERGAAVPVPAGAAQPVQDQVAPERSPRSIYSICQSKHFPAQLVAGWRWRGGMDRDQTVALFSQGRDAWNAWAEDRLAARKVLEAEGLWLPKRDWFGHNKIKYAEARLWMESAAADFSGVYFLGAGEKAREEPKEAEGGKPPAEPNPLEPRPANFEGFVFPGDVRFDGATFLGASAFDGATFWGDAWFKNVSFRGAAFFKSANFKGGAVFDRSRFRGDAWFRSAELHGPRLV